MHRAYAVVVYVLKLVIIRAFCWRCVYIAVTSPGSGIALGRDEGIVDLFVSTVLAPPGAVDIETSVIDLGGRFPRQDNITTGICLRFEVK